MKTQRTFKPWWAMASLSVLVAACGGSGGGDSGSEIPVTPSNPSLTSRIEPYDPSGVAKSTTAVAAVGGAASNAIRTLALGPLPVTDTLAKSSAATAPGAPQQIGVARDVEVTTSVTGLGALLDWRVSNGGTQLAALAFSSDSAKGLRLGVLVRALPVGSILRFYSEAGAAATEVTAEELRAIAERNAQGGASDDVARTYWSPDFAGAVTVLEVEIPAGASSSDVRIAVPRVSHFTRTAGEAEEAFSAKVGESGSCNIDVTCRSEASSESRSVARMIFVSDDGKSYVCTGTLLNDAGSTGTPYFLSANHCVSSQSVASTLTTDWFYRSSACNTTDVSSAAVRLAGGATLLHATATTDTSFMRLNNPPPAGIVYAGSYFGGGIGIGTSALLGVHHPQGDLQKLSVGTLQRYSTCSGETCQTSTVDNGTFLTLGWQEGTTEGGSSGSSLFYGIGDKRYVVGQLFGGTASCTARNGVDHYGRFDRPYQATLKQWLNPNGA